MLGSIGHTDYVLVCDRLVAHYMTLERYNDAQHWIRNVISSRREAPTTKELVTLNNAQYADANAVAAKIAFKLDLFDDAEVNIDPLGFCWLYRW